MTSIPASWCADSLVVTVNGPQGRSTTAINKPYARVGSHAGSEVLLSGPGIEPRSLYLHATSEGVFGVRLQANSKSTLGSGSWLGANDWLRVGPYEISARLQREEVESPPRAGLTAWGSATPPLPVCEISSDGNVRDKRRFRARLNLVGRRRELALQLLGKQVSSCHCALYWDSGKLWCIDLLSSNGTLLDGQLIECAQLELGSSVLIGEFSLKFSRLSKSTPRQSSWRTGDSEEDPPSEQSAGSQADFPADLLSQTVSVATGDTGRAEPDSAESLSVPNLEPQIAPASQLIPPPPVEPPADQHQLQEELSRRSLSLLKQRQNLELQWQKANQEVAAQVSLLQSESALLVAQRHEMARLRAEFETQRQVVTEDLLALQREQQLAQRTGAPEARQHAALGDHSSSPQEVTPQQALSEEMLDTEFPAALEAGSRGETDAGRYVPAIPPGARTIIEGSYVVERETPGPRPTQPLMYPERFLPTPAPEMPPTHTTGGQRQELTVIEPADASRAAGASGASTPRVSGRKGRVQSDQLGEYMADRLAQGNGSQRFWLRILWIIAAFVTLAALVGLGYVVLRSQ